MNVALNTSEAVRLQRPLYRFGGLLRGYRTAAGKTQAAVANELGVTPPRVNAIERGRAAGPDDGLVQRLERMLGLTPDQAAFMREVAVRDRVLLCAVRSGLHEEKVRFLSACLDAAVAFAPQELGLFRQGIAAQVVARGRAARLLGQPSLDDATVTT